MDNGFFLKLGQDTRLSAERPCNDMVSLYLTFGQAMHGVHMSEAAAAQLGAYLARNEGSAHSETKRQLAEVREILRSTREWQREAVDRIEALQEDCDHWRRAADRARAAEKVAENIRTILDWSGGSDFDLVGGDKLREWADMLEKGVSHA